MIEINIDPVLHLGTWGIKWITLSLIGAIIVVIAVGIIGLRRVGISLAPRNIIGMSLSFIIGLVVGARLFYVIDNWSYYLEHPQAIFSLAGIVIYGAVIGSVIAIAIYARIGKLSFWRWGDAIAPGAMLGMALYRVGCIFNGCCFGLEAHLPWSVVYTSAQSHAPFGKLLHPTQMYHLLLGLLAFAALWPLQRRLKTEGSLFLLWLILFAATDLPVRFFRVAETFFLGIQLAVIVDVVILAVTIPWFVTRICSANHPDTTTTLQPGT